MINETGHDLVMSQFQMMQLHGKKGNNVDAKFCLDSAKRIWEELSDVDETVKVNLDYYKKNYANFCKMLEK